MTARDPITIFGLDPLGLVLIALGCLGWRYGAKVKRRPHQGRRFGGESDEEASEALAEDYRDPARQNQDRPLGEDGQPGGCRVGLPRSRP